MTRSQDAHAGPPRSRPDDHDFADAMRRFARFYTRRIGLLDQRLNGGPFSLTEARVLYELHARGQETASRLGADLGLDPGYLSRLLKRFEAQGLIARRPDAADARRAIVSLTAAGERAYAPLKHASRASMLDLAGALGADDRARLLGAMAEVERLLSPTGDEAGAGDRNAGAITLRAPRPGDWGWVVARHAEIYSGEFGWDRRFEADVAEIVAGMIREAGTPGTGAWVAEIGGRRVGFTGLSRKDARTAKLRLVLLEAEARGRGLGRRLVETAIDRARENGDTAVELMTRDVLTAARSLYASLGFERMRSEPAAPYGVAFHDEFWRLDLA